MKHLVKIFEETKKLKSDLTRHEFSTDFFAQTTQLFFFLSLIPI
mgnify:FL=1